MFLDFEQFTESSGKTKKQSKLGSEALKELKSNITCLSLLPEVVSGRGPGCTKVWKHQGEVFVC